MSAQAAAAAEPAPPSRPRAALARLEALFDRAFTPAHNPWRQLGALCFFFLWVTLASGAYVYAFSETGVERAYRSVEYLTREQWYLGGIARSLHRYAADAFVLVMAAHLGREWIAGRYRGFRWFSWVTGVPLVWLALLSGVVGFWLVWDKLAQFAAAASAELLDALPLFSEPLVRNFLTDGDITDRFFTLAMFLHLGVPLALVLAAWLHLHRISRPAVHPTRPLAVGSLLALLALSLLQPVTSHEAANLATVPRELGLDWFYLFPLPLVYAWSPLAVWLAAGGATLALLLLPWARREARARAPVAEVSLDYCNGCGRCYQDCPYAAVVLRPRSDARRAPREAVVLADLCAGCGICAGACPSSTPFQQAAAITTGIDMPQLRITRLREQLEAAAGALTGPARIMIFGCDLAVPVEKLRSPGTAAFSLLCIGQLPPSFVEYALRSGADGVLITGCAEGDCAYRLGNRWTEERLRGAREPHLRRSVPQARWRVRWAGPGDAAALERDLAGFRAELAALGAARLPPPRRRVRVPGG